MRSSENRTNERPEPADGLSELLAGLRLEYDYPGSVHLPSYVQVFGMWGDVIDEDLVISDRAHQPTYCRHDSRHPLSTDVQDALELAHGFAWLYCGGPATQMDHIVPRALKGSNREDNLAPACWPCNKSKRALYLWEWLRKHPELDQQAIRDRWAAARGDLLLPGMAQ